MNLANLADLLDELIDQAVYSASLPYEEDLPDDLMTRARAAAERLRQEAGYCDSDCDVVESVAGLSDESTPAGEAWARIRAMLARYA